MKRLNVISVIIVLLSLSHLFGDYQLAAGPGQSKPLSRIVKVTVFRGHAMVTRELNVHISPGRQTLVFSGLPLSLRDNSVQVSGKGSTAVTMLDVQVKRDFFVQSPKEDRETLISRKESMEQKTGELNDRLIALGKKEKFLEDLMQKTLDAIGQDKNVGTVPLANYKNMSDFLENRLNAVYTAKREIDRQIKPLTEEISVIQQKLARNPNSQRKERKNVHVEIRAKQAGKFKLTLSYLVPNATWTPGYNLRIASGKKHATLTYTASIRQTTGEDWKNTKIAISTAEPMEPSDPPQMKSIRLGLVSDENGMIAGSIVLDDGSQLPGVTLILSGRGRVWNQVTDEKGRYRFLNIPEGNYHITAQLEGLNTVRYENIQVTAGKIRQIDIGMRLKSLEESVVINGKDPTVDRRSSTGTANLDEEYLSSVPSRATVAQKLLYTDYYLKYTETINSSTEAKKVTVSVTQIPVQLKYITIPNYSRHVFLNVSAVNTTGSPLLPGSLDMFLDHRYIRTTQIGFLNPEKAFELSLGIDKSFDINRTSLKKKAEVKGFLSKRNEIPSGYEIKIKNLKKTTANLIVKDQIPVSRDEKVKIDLQVLNPKPEELNKKNGYLIWKIALKPGQERVISVKYLIRHPKKRILRVLED